jgi:hypothetical protein
MRERYSIAPGAAAAAAAAAPAAAAKVDCSIKTPAKNSITHRHMIVTCSQTPVKL